MITLEQLVAIMPRARNPAMWLGPINDAMEEFGIDTARRQAAFLAQISHESGQLRYTREIASGEAYDTGRLAKRLGNTPAADGDGQRYKGRGLIQITGRYNYRHCSIALYGIPEMLLDNPEMLEQPIPAARSAAWYWWSRGLNMIADCPNSFEAITRHINGGLNGLPDRLAAFDRSNRALMEA